MKSIKLVLLSLVIIFLVVLVWQNSGVFMDKKALRLNLPVWGDHQTQPIYLFLYFLSLFFIGLLVSYFYGLSERFKANKTIRNHLETIRKLEEEIKVFKSLPVYKESTPSKETENA